MEKIIAKPEAIAVIESLKQKHGNILFEQSYGCCDGTTPMCYSADGHYISSQLELVGTIADVPYYIDKKQLKYMAHMQQILGVSKGNGASFSLESAEGLSFTLESHVVK